MADGISYRLISSPTLEAMKKIEREIQRANVAAVRAAGRELQKEARSNAPVYEGDRKDVPKGRLKKGIKAGRVKKIGATSASVKVGPRGQIVHLYAGTIEAQQPYMSVSYRDAAERLVSISAAAYTKAMERATK